MDITLDSQGRPLFEPVKAEAIRAAFLDLTCVMERLRSDCPWDRKQKLDGLKRYVLEETYEVLEAIETEDWDGLRDELGDYLFQVFFVAKLMAERGCFDIEAVVRGVTEKMVRRHPHVFAGRKVDGAGEVSATWDVIKAAEKGLDPDAPSSLFDGFTTGLPALLASYKIGKKAAKVGFDWPEPLRVLDKIEEEIGEIREALQDGKPDKVQEELGDLLFAVSNLVRKFGYEPEETLRSANRKFISRFQAMERLAEQDGVDFAALDLDSQEGYWVRAKQVSVSS